MTPHTRQHDTSFRQWMKNIDNAGIGNLILNYYSFMTLRSKRSTGPSRKSAIRRAKETRKAKIRIPTLSPPPLHTVNISAGDSDNFKMSLFRNALEGTITKSKKYTINIITNGLVFLSRWEPSRESKFKQVFRVYVLVCLLIPTPHHQHPARLVAGDSAAPLQ